MHFVRLALPVLALAAASCQPNWISPYSEDLQKRATDLLSDVTATEITLAHTSDRAAADPAQPAIQAKLAAWAGDVEAMAAIEESIDPGSAACDKALSALGGTAISSLEARATATGAMGHAGSAPLILKCESLPDVFARLRNEFVERVPAILASQCKAGQSPAQFASRCQFLFRPDAMDGPQARHGLLFSASITGLDAIIFREGQQAPRAGSS